MKPTFKIGATAAAAAALALTTGAISSQPPLTTVRVAANLARPIYVGSPPGDESRLFVAEQHSGLIRIIKNGELLPTPFLNVRSRILTGSERGLLGLAFHPNYATNGYLYINFTRAGDGATIVARFTRSAVNPDVGDPNSYFPIVGPVSQPFSNHNAGALAFGLDGYLYIPLGDGGSANDPNCNAQNGQVFLGKILRIDVDGGTPYAVPASNPFVGNPAVLDEIWSLGWRNPWRFSFDRLTGDMYVGDVGQGAREEISFQPASSTGGGNYGWKMMEGTRCNATTACTNPPPCNSPLLTLPIHDYLSTGDCAVIGGYVYRGCGIPGLEGTYFFGDYCTGRLASFRYDGTTVTEFTQRTNELRPNVGEIDNITSFGEDAHGEIYIADLDGEIFKIVPAGAAPARNLGFWGVGSNGLRPRFEMCGLLGAGQSAKLVLRDAPASSLAALVISTSNNPVQLPFGTVLPVPPQLVAPFPIDADGRVELMVQGGLGPAVIYAQWAVVDQGLPTGLNMSNALEITFP
jgi:glucose/arabinose dehydrogenase